MTGYVEPNDVAQVYADRIALITYITALETIARAAIEETGAEDKRRQDPQERRLEDAGIRNRATSAAATSRRKVVHDYLKTVQG